MRTIKTLIETRVVRHPFSGAAVIFVALAGSLLASGALASTAKQARYSHAQETYKRSGLAVFSRPLGKRARLARVSGPQVPVGSVLAAVSGKNEIYAWQPTPSQETQSMQTADNGNSTCIVEMLNGLESIACGPTAKIEDHGIIGINLPSVATPTLDAAALVPNGVTNVTVTDNDGFTRTVPVSNNAVFIEDPNLASVSFELPNGEINRATVNEAIADKVAP